MKVGLGVRVGVAASALASLLAAGCADVFADLNTYMEREEQRFSTTGTPEVALSTFDGSIEIRAWDRPEVEVVVERRGVSKAAAREIEVRAQQNGSRITVDVTAPKRTGIRGNGSRSARMIVSLPASSNVAARTGDGSIRLERITGRLDLRSGDGSIHGHDLSGDLKAQTGDGSVALERVTGSLDVDTGDGSVSASGRFSSLRARSGDGSVSIHAESGSAATGGWDLSTGDGSVTLELPAEFNGELDAHTGDGTVRLNDVGVEGGTEARRKNTLRERLGSGGGTVRIRTGDGSIRVRRS
jgi:DUF4097 and DUF4098 domain-containing protein YvlB